MCPYDAKGLTSSFIQSGLGSPPALDPVFFKNPLPPGISCLEKLVLWFFPVVYPKREYRA